MDDVVVLTPRRWAHGGEAVARLDGKTVFVADALPGETVRARVIIEKPSWARAELVEVLEPSEDRITPPCPVFGVCGGCQWQHVRPDVQASAKRQILIGQLEHVGGLEEAPVRAMMSPGPEFGYRNRMAFRVDPGGRPSMYRRRSRHHVALPGCLLLTPRLVDVFGRLGSLEGAKGIVLRAGVRTGEALAVVGGRLPPQIASWEISVVHGHGAAIGSPFIHEEVAGVRLRISGRAFFQVNTDGAEALVDLVREAIAPQANETLLDGYAGVGLFSATVGRDAARVIAVESDGRSIHDLERNTDAMEARIVRGRFEDGVDDTWDVAVVDPPRSGLGARGVEMVSRTSPRAVAYVSCDPAALARDMRYFDDHGYVCRWIAPVDMFPQTFHIEAVAAFSLR
jgi:23S rRNA (uracil1939-C5)-methyltransferase